MPQTVKAQTNVASAQKTANNETAQKPVTFNTASNTTNNVQEKTAPAVQPQTTETVNNEAAVKPQQPVASQSVAQGSAKTISTPSASEQNASVEKPVVEKQTVAQPEVAAQTKANAQPASASVKPQIVQNVQKEAEPKANNNIVAPKAAQENVKVNQSVKEDAPVQAKESFNTTASDVASAEQSVETSVKGVASADTNIQANAVKGVAGVNASTAKNDDSDKDSNDSGSVREQDYKDAINGSNNLSNEQKSALSSLIENGRISSNDAKSLPMNMVIKDGQGHESLAIRTPNGDMALMPLELADTSTTVGQETIPGTLYGNGNELKCPQDSLVMTQQMWMTIAGKTFDCFCLQPLANGPLELAHSKQVPVKMADVTNEIKGNNELLGVMYYGYGSPKSIVGHSDLDNLYTHLAACVAAWDTDAFGIKDFESNKAKAGSGWINQAAIDKWRQYPEVAKLLNAAKGFNEQQMDKDGYTFTAYNGHGIGKNGQFIMGSQDIFGVSWVKKPTPTQAKPTQHVSQGTQKKPTQPAKTQPTQTQKKTQPTQKVTQKTQPVTQKTQPQTQKPTQPVTQPISIGTTLVGSNGHEIAISSNATATDTVNYKNLQVGKKYTMKGTLMDKKTGKPVMQNGQPVTASTTFTPSSANGSVNVVFHFNDTSVAGDSLVAYEDLYDQNNNKVASHDDINDTSETDTVEKPSIGTTLVGTNGHELQISKSAIATDTVNYTDLIPGQKYTMTGTLMDKATGKPVMNNGKPVTAFTPQKANGSVNVVFHLDDTNYAGDSLVAYEDLTDSNGTKIASHDNINDTAETDTVEKPEIGTTLVGSNGTHILPFSNNVSATDTVAYKDLIPGKKYTMKGTLMDKNTGKVVMENGKPVTAETTFTPTSVNGSVKLTFTLNDEALAGDSLVAYEDLYDENGNEIVAHDNINDQAETQCF